MIVLRTDRLVVRTAEPADADFVAALWNDPDVMRYVGFPEGLGTAAREVLARIDSPADGVFGRILIITLKDGTAIGNAHIGRVDDDGITETDVKLDPAFWGYGFGREVKHGLVEYIFANTCACAVQATPNRRNKASIRMQEHVGAEPVGEGTFVFPEDKRGNTCPVEYIVYRIRREDWRKRCR